MSRYMFTGGAGFIASHIIESLIEDNEIVVYDNFSRNALQYTNFENHKNLYVVKGDVLDAEQLSKAAEGCDVIIHCAAVAGIQSTARSTNRTMKTNLIGTYNALEAAIKNNVKKFVDFSTSEVYGPSVYKAPEDGFTTLGFIGENRWAYAVSKIAGEHLAHSYAQEYGINVVSVRPFNVFGPRQVGEGAIEQMVTRANQGKPITVYNDGTQIRAWCYVKDFARAIVEIITNDKIKNEVFNIGTPQNTITVLGLAEKILELTDSNSEIVYKAHPGAEVEIRVPDINKAQKLLNFKPEVKLNDGILKTIEWYKNNIDSFKS